MVYLVFFKDFNWLIIFERQKIPHKNVDFSRVLVAHAYHSKLLRRLRSRGL
jgi:hypothetical protein